MCTLRPNSFRERFPQCHRPELTDLEDFWRAETAALFRDFAEYLLQEYDLRFGVPVWSETDGWTYRIGKSGVYLFRKIRILTEGFVVDGIAVRDRADYALLLEHAAGVYEQKEQEFRRKIAAVNSRQAQREKVRVQREREERKALQDRLLPEKYNVFRWPCKLDVCKLRKLYRQDAAGIRDMELVDEVGLTLYLRCKYGKEDMERMERGAIRCHGCGGEIGGAEDFRQCSCGYQYSYREYRRSFRRNNMPTGAAAKVFEEYIRQWERADGYGEKMLLIDRLLHEFHLSLISGVQHRPVAMNFLDGTRKQVDEVIRSLAETE